jgi:hypothetical protein
MVGVFKASYAVTDTNFIPLVWPEPLLIRLPRLCTACAAVQTDPDEQPTSLPMIALNASCARSHLHERTIVLKLTG